MKIVIADNDGEVSRLLHVDLATTSDEVIEAQNEERIQLTLDSGDPCVVLFGWTSPGVTGARLCQLVRLRDPTQAYVFMIALTNPADPIERLDAFRAGVDAVVTKPCDPNEIAIRLEVARRICEREATLQSRSEALELIRAHLETENATLSQIALCDALTGLRNRRYFCEALEAQFALARRKGLPMSLVMLDVDQFKAYNDQFGHLAGDEVLQVLGALLRSCVRDHDIVARYGGEEFAILLPATEAQESLPLADRLRLTIADHPWVHRPVTISLGIATLSPSMTQPSALINLADRSLYYSKAMGRNKATHAREITDLVADALHERLNREPMFAGTMAAQSYPSTINASVPDS